MALSTTPVDLNRGSDYLTLPPELSREVIQGAIAESAIMKLAPRIILPGAGASIPVITGDAVAGIVAESTEKPVSTAQVETRVMTPYTFALIEIFSNEFKRDFDALYEALVKRLPGSIAAAFDKEVFTGAGSLTGFDTLAGVTAIARGAGDKIQDVISDGFAAVAANNYRVNGIAVAPAYGTELVMANDNTGRPLFVPNANDGGTVGRVYGADVAESTAITTMVGGDWNKARWGMVDNIQLAISDQATINDGTNQINLWQRNCFAARIECQMSFLCFDENAFFTVTDDGESS